MTSKTTGKPPRSHKGPAPPPPGSGGGSGGGSGSSRKHHGHGGKHGAPSPPPKHQHHRPGKHQQKQHKRKRGWSPGYEIDCCSAEALGTLLGFGWEGILALYGRTNGPASVLDTLAAAGYPALVWPAGVIPAAGASLILGAVLPEPHALAVKSDGTWWSWGEPFSPLEWPELVIEEAWALWP